MFHRVGEENEINMSLNGKRIAAWMGKMLLLTTVASATVLPAAGPAEAADGETKRLTLRSEEPITSGAILKRYQWTGERSGKPVQVNVQVIETDLQNPYVHIDTIAGTDGQYTLRQSIRDMAADTGAVAAVNGDFYNTQAEGVPMGPQIMGGELLATPLYLPGFYSFVITKDRKPLIDLFTFEGKIVAEDGASYPLGGINKTYYWFENDGVHEPGKHSHIDGLFMYTNAWGQVDRSNDGVTVPTEVLVEDNKITRIQPYGIIPMIAPENGYILRASGLADEFVREHLKVGDTLVADYRMLPQHTYQNYDIDNFQTMIGGHTILVHEGQPTAFTREPSSADGYRFRSRTAIGYSKDERYVYMITAERTNESGGLSFPELQQVMIELGVWKGLNLDGGGSTQMVHRPLGDTRLVVSNRLENGVERKVVNGIAVYTTAPEGKVQGIAVSGNAKLFINEKATFALKAYDEFYNPVDTSRMPTVWTLKHDVGAFEENVLSARQPGKTEVVVASGEAKAAYPIEIVGKNEIAKMEILTGSPILLPDGTYRLPVQVTTRDGVTRIVPPELIEWEVSGFAGTMEGDLLTIRSIDKETKQGQIIASYDGFRVSRTFSLGNERLWADFDKRTYPISFNGYPAEVAGEAKLLKSLPGQPAGSSSLYLAYDFTKGTGTKAAYALFGEKGIPVEGEPQSMKLRVMGDDSLNWLRAEIVDAEGELKRVELSTSINWNGWKTVTADLAGLQLAYPITLKRLYVANPEVGQDERALTGKIAVDDISFMYKAETKEDDKVIVQMTVNQKSLTANGQTITLDQAPVIINEKTMVPVRVLVEAMGGEVDWVADDPQDRRVTLRKGGHLIDMWIDDPVVIVDGTAVTSETAPLILNDRTMLPLRLIAESLGWNVGWDAKTGSITLE